MVITPTQSAAQWASSIEARSKGWQEFVKNLQIFHPVCWCAPQLLGIHNDITQLVKMELQGKTDGPCHAALTLILYTSMAKWMIGSVKKCLCWHDLFDSFIV